jgi:hypothetical protein
MMFSSWRPSSFVTIRCSVDLVVRCHRENFERKDFLATKLDFHASSHLIHQKSRQL